MSSSRTEEMIAALEASGDYKVLRRLSIGNPFAEAPRGTRRAVVADVETTGLDCETNEIIELAMVPFFYTFAGEIVGVGFPFNGVRQPSIPIPPEVTRLTGIDDAMVAGKSIDPSEVATFAGPGLVIAHNAPFDRPFLEKFCPALAENPWACSLNEVSWSDEGFESAKPHFWRWLPASFTTSTGRCMTAMRRSNCLAALCRSVDTALCQSFYSLPEARHIDAGH